MILNKLKELNVTSIVKMASSYVLRDSNWRI